MDAVPMDGGRLREVIPEMDNDMIAFTHVERGARDATVVGEHFALHTGLKRERSNRGGDVHFHRLRLLRDVDQNVRVRPVSRRSGMFVGCAVGLARTRQRDERAGQRQQREERETGSHASPHSWWRAANIGEPGQACKRYFSLCRAGTTCLDTQILLTTSRWSSTLALALALTANAAADVRAQSSRVTTPLSTIELRQGLVITKSGRVAPRTYRLPPPASPDSSVITIRGNDITVDFAGATMDGAPSDVNPDDVSGIAVRVDGGRNVRILNAHIHGYKVGIIARGTRGLLLIDNDLSYNWKPRLYSAIEHESLIDWLSFHHNEKDEWLRYGAGAYLNDVEAGEISGNTVTQGMNGLMLVRTSGFRIWNNNFSFNSGLGIG